MIVQALCTDVFLPEAKLMLTCLLQIIWELDHVPLIL
jgi:hypothetical protein